MRDSVAGGKVWTYPELTASLSKVKDKNIISDDAKKLLEHRLTAKELQIIDGVLDGLTNDAIAEKLGITTRTVKAHMTSIFTKLHINDRVSLILLIATT
jgi:DNA-binding NarL/FixJ family response regulator